jgi:G3E family GTPase
MRKDLSTYPVIVLTGFLGSGKTTILNQLIRDPAFKRTLVLINEFGDVGLDHDLVTQGSEDAHYVEMASGCLCCSIRGDLVRTLAQAPSRFARHGRCWFDRVLIETTGLADPAPILHTLMAEPSIMRRYELAGVVTAVDAANGERTLDMHPESVKQAAVADLLLLTKTDLTNDTTPPSLAAMLRRLNPGADQITTESADNIARRFNELGLYDPGTKTPNVERWLQEEHHHGHGSHHHHDVNRHGPDIQAFSITRSQPLPLVTLENWLDILRATLGEQLLRVKGILNVEGYDTACAAPYRCTRSMAEHRPQDTSGLHHQRH